MSSSRPRRMLPRLGVLAVATAAVGLGSTPTALAATRAPTLRLVAAPPPHEHRAVELVATLERPGPTGNAAMLPAVGDHVSFSVRVSEFAGAPLLALGSATTNSSGVATLTYQPSWTGQQVFVATATNAAGTPLASARASFDATTSVQGFAGTVEAVRPDGGIGRAVAGTLLAIVAILWIALVGVVVRVKLGLGGGALRGEGRATTASR